MKRILVVDNHDSFVFNLVQYLLELGADCTVKDRSDVSLGDAVQVDGIMLSPGPGHPLDAGICLDLVKYADHHEVPLLGVCLGHQVIAVAYGGTVGRAPEVVHGYTSAVRHTGAGALAGLPDPFNATRYHSLAVDPGTVPPDLEITAWTGTEDPWDDSRTAAVIMGVRHRSKPIEGVQFHPESVLSEGGHRLLGNWVDAVG